MSRFLKQSSKPDTYTAEVGTQERLFEIDDGPLRAGQTDLRSHDEIELHVGDGLEILSVFPDVHFDWIYMGRDRFYKGVSRDLRVAHTKVRPGGLLISNRFTYWPPTERIDYAVPHALCEFTPQHDFVFVYFADDIALRHPLLTECG